MDDVDRLFQCFKCGISPPESALRERKKEKRKLMLKNREQGASTSYGTQSPKSSDKIQERSLDALPHVRNIDSSTESREKVRKGKQFSPIVFYGSPNGVPPKRPARLLRLLHEIQIDIAEQNKLREEIWATYPRQDEAMKYVKEHPQARVFCYQDHMTGQRRYLASTYNEFWKRYKNMIPVFRHHYEVIQEGSPCHIYFDLEFSKKHNINKNGDEMVDLLLLVVFDTLLEKYSIHGDHEWVIELDSSTEAILTADKFSRHLIIRLPKTAFKDNSHVGAFVAEVCSRIYCSRGKDKKFEELFVSKDSSSSEIVLQLFVDNAVYTRNRCFRLPLSSKAGKSSVLLPSGRFKSKNMAEEELFMASLICRTDADCEKLLICKMDAECVKTLHFDTEATSGCTSQTGLMQKFDWSGCKTDASVQYSTEKSPFPVLDKFIEFITSTGNVPGKIRSWYWFSEEGLIVYSMSRNRYCERIGREHKSNHVMYVVDLRRASYYQKCHDPDCRGYRSPLRNIPEDVLPDYSFSFNLAGGNEGQGPLSLTPDGSNMDSCRNDWWLEAIRVAEKLENTQKTLDLNCLDEGCEDDDQWWMAVEQIASQTELAYLEQPEQA
ncbi:hypothetical protein Leryth_015739 [Lithospermum erythrorhizon]|nr:hypothetical protein Leryth_015739 [Lithospermum erythrorhizon]